MSVRLMFEPVTSIFSSFCGSAAAGGGNDLVGARLTAVGGLPIAEVLAQVAPVVPHDNPTTGVKTFRAMYLLNEEVLDGLGIKPRFALALPGGKRVVWALTIRVALSVGLFAFLWFSYWMGWIGPQGIR